MNKTFIIIGSIFGAILVIGLFLLGYKKDDGSGTPSQNVTNKQEEQPQSTVSQVSAQDIQEENQAEQESEPEVNDIAIDENKEPLKTYTNNSLGFSLLVPNVEQINVKEDRDAVYIGTADSLRKLAADQDAFRSSNSNATDYDLVKYVPWGILIKSAKDDNELQQVIQNRYGSNCKLGRKQSTSQVGLFDVKLDGKNLNTEKEGSCDVYWSYVIKYDQYRGKVAIWDIGIDADFVINGVAQDDKMADSFRFQ